MMNSSVARMSLFKVIKFIYETREKSTSISPHLRADCEDC